MNSKQRRQFNRLKLRTFPKGCRVQVAGYAGIYTVVHHWVGMFDASPLVCVRAADLINSAVMSVNFNRLSIAAHAANSETEKPAGAGE